MADCVSADNSWTRNIRRCQSFLRYFIFYRFRSSAFNLFRFWVFEYDFRRSLAALFRRVESEISVRPRRVRKRRVFVKSLKRQRKSGGKKALFRLSFDTSSLFWLVFWFRLADFVQTAIQTERQNKYKNPRKIMKCSVTRQTEKLVFVLITREFCGHNPGHGWAISRAFFRDNHINTNCQFFTVRKMNSFRDYDN